MFVSSHGAPPNTPFGSNLKFYTKNVIGKKHFAIVDSVSVSRVRIIVCCFFYNESSNGCPEARYFLGLWQLV